jgi:hypothetical protein
MGEKVTKYLEVGPRRRFIGNIIERPSANNVEPSRSDVMDGQGHVVICRHVEPICIRPIEAKGTANSVSGGRRRMGSKK